MTFAFYLHEPQKDVTPAQQKATPLRLIVSHNGCKYKKFIGISIKPCDFKKQRTGNPDDDRRLNEIEIRLKERLNRFSTDEEVKAAIEYAISGEEPKKTGIAAAGVHKKNPLPVPSFWEYFKSWGERNVPAQRQRKLCYTRIKELMGTAENWEDIDTAYYYRLCQKMKERGYSVNYQWCITTRLKRVMNEGYLQKFHHNDEFRQFKAAKEDAVSIALTPEEIDKLWAVELHGDLHRKIRDLFLIGYYTGARFSDYSRISTENIKDGRLEFYQQKTQDKVIIPASPKLLMLLQRNGGRAPEVNQVVFNRYIKVIARQAGIDGIVQLPRNRQKEDGSPTYRWEMVESHTARRSCVTNLYLSGVPARECMFISGHKDLRSFEKYIKVTKEQAAERLSENEFFK